MIRYRNVDIVRLISMIAVVMIHTTASFAGAYPTLMWENQAARFAVPAFIIISGFVLYSTEDHFVRKGAYVDFLKKRLGRVIPPYIIWSFIYLMFNSITTREVTLSSALKDIATGNAYVHLYFVFIMIQFYFLFPILAEAYRRFPKIVLYLSFAITVIIQYGMYFSDMGLYTMPNTFIPAGRLFVTYLFYFVLGMHLKNNADTMMKTLSRSVFSLLILWVVSLYVMHWDAVQTGTSALSTRPSVIPYAVLTVFLLLGLFYHANRSELPFYGMLSSLAQQSFFVYLSHLLVMQIILLIANQTGKREFYWTVYGTNYLFFITLIISILIAVFISRIPVGKWLGATYAEYGFLDGKKSKASSEEPDNGQDEEIGPEEESETLNTEKETISALKSTVKKARETPAGIPGKVKNIFKRN